MSRRQPGGSAGTTKQIAPDEWETFFDNFTRAHLRDSIPKTVTAEVISPLLGDQTALSNARLLGLTFDPKSKAFEVVVKGAAHFIFRPVAIWVVEDQPNGFVSTIELVRADGIKEILHLRRSGLPAI
jgi:hypothetical protein